MKKDKRKPHFDSYVGSPTFLVANPRQRTKETKESNQLSQSVIRVLDKVLSSLFWSPRLWKKKKLQFNLSIFFPFSHYFLGIQSFLSSLEVFPQHPKDCISPGSRLFELRIEIEAVPWTRRWIGTQRCYETQRSDRDYWMLCADGAPGFLYCNRKPQSVVHRKCRIGQLTMGWSRAGPI